MRPPASLSRLLLEVRDGDDVPAQQAYAFDGGLALPQTVRLLVDGPTLQVTATAFEPDGEQRQQTQRLAGLSAGSSAKLTLDLSATRACPAPPPQAGETVIYDDSFAPGWSPFGFTVGGFTSQAGGERCSGSSALRYQVTRLYDGVGFDVAPPTGLRSVSFRLWLPRQNTAQLSVAQLPNANGTTFVVPRPEQCTFNAPGLCDLPLVAGWQRVFVEVPASLVGLQSILFQLRDPFIDPFELFIDDVRVALRP